MELWSHCGVALFRPYFVVFLLVEDEKVIELHKVFEDAVTYMNRSKFKFLLLLMTCLSKFCTHIFALIHYLWESDCFSPCRMKTYFCENQ